MFNRYTVFSVSLMLLAVVATGGAIADEGRFQCRQDGLIRSVMIVYEIPGKAVPCQVVYSKPTENEADRVLWSANSESGYCEFKAREFRAQMESWGWTCDEEREPPAEAEQLGDAPVSPADTDVSD